MKKFINKKYFIITQMKNPYTFKLTDIKEINFFNGGKEISAEELFNLVYQGLDDMIDLITGNKAGMYSNNMITPQDNRIKTSRNEWAKEVDKLALTASLSLKRNKILTADISQRTDFNYISKKPNILHLTFPSGERIILRESKIHMPSTVRTIFDKKRESQIGRQISNNYSKIFINPPSFMRDKKPEILFNKHKAYFIPEPILLDVLEQFYEKGIPRLTPERKIIEKGKNVTYSLRPFYDKLSDTGLSKENLHALGNYFGTLHMLGLVDNCDAQGNHYMLDKKPGNGSSVINIDPDFMIYLPHNNSTIHELRTEFEYAIKGAREMLKKSTNEEGLGLTDSDLERTRSTYGSKLEILTYQESFKKALEERIKTYLDNDRSL